MTKLIPFLLTILLVPSAFAEDKMKMSFKNEDVLNIIQAYSKASGQKFVVDPGVRGRASIFLQESVPVSEAFNHLSSALALNGFAISKQGDTMIVQSARNTQRNLVEVSSEVPALKPERMHTWIYTAKHVPASQINRELRILPSKDGEMNINESTNQIIITDWTSNLNRVAEILKSVDTLPSPETAKLVEASKKDRRHQGPRKYDENRKEKSEPKKQD